MTFGMYNQNINPASLANTMGMLFQGTGTNVISNGTSCIGNYLNGYSSFGCCDNGFSTEDWGYMVGSGIFNTVAYAFKSARYQKTSQANEDIKAMSESSKNLEQCLTECEKIKTNLDNQWQVVQDKGAAVERAEQAKDGHKIDITDIKTSITSAKTALQTAQEAYNSNSTTENLTKLEAARKNLEALQKELDAALKAEEDYKKAKAELQKEASKYEDIYTDFKSAYATLKNALNEANAIEAKINAKEQAEQIDKVDGNWFTDVLHKDNIQYNENGTVADSQNYSNITKYDMQKLLSKYRKANSSEKAKLKDAIKKAYNANRQDPNVITKDLEVVIKTIID